MVITTNSPQLRELRRNIFELIVSEHPFQCVTCLKNLRCELQEVASYVGLERTAITLPPTYKKVPVYEDSPFFVRDYNLCILCGRCVRVCGEVRGAAAVAFTWRGPQALVGTAFSQTLEEAGCQFCGACVDVCPTGALMDRSVKISWPVERSVVTTCPYCGVGCQLKLGIKAGKIVTADAVDAPANRGQACVKGKYGIPEFVHHPQRLTKPLVRKDGKLVESTWEEALSLVATKLAQYKGDQFTFVSSAKCTNEENYVAQKFTRAVMGTNNVDHCARLCHASTVAGLAQAFGSGAMTNSIADIGEAACVLLIGCNPSIAHPVIALEVRKAAKRGAKVIIINPREIPLRRFADAWVRHLPGSDVALLMGMMRVILEENLADTAFVNDRCENFEAFKASLADFSLDRVEKLTGVPAGEIGAAARMYATAKPASILFTMGITQSSHGTDNVLAVANLAMLTGNVGRPWSGVNPLRGQNNVQGACDMGALPNVYSGYQSVADPAIASKFAALWGGTMPMKPGITLTETIPAIHEGRVKAMYLMGENPVLSEADALHAKTALEKLDFLVAQDIFLTESAALAHVVLPAASFAEKEGTFTNTERRVQRVRAAVEPPGEAKPDWWILGEIARRMGAKGFAFENAEQIMGEVATVTPSYGGINYNRLENGGLQWPCPTPEHPGTPILHIGKFTRGRGRFTALAYRAPAETSDSEYPLIMTTGRLLYHYHTGTMTRKVSGLNTLAPESVVEISPADAERIGIGGGERVKVISRRGAIVTRAKVTDATPTGLVFMSFHYGESSANVLTNAALDPVCKIPELKVSAVRIEKA